MATKSRWPRRIAIGAGALVLLIAGLFVAFHVPDIPVEDLRAKYGSPASRYVEIAPGTVIHLRDEGPRDGFPIVLLHGSNASLHTWEPWVARLTPKYRVISFDFPAHGLSGPVPSRDYSQASYVAVTEKIVDRLGLTRFALAGNSMGGGVAWHYAAAHPDKVAGLVLVDSVGEPEPGESTPPIGFRIAGMPVIRDLLASVLPRSMIDQSLHQSVSVQSIVTPAAVDRYWELLRYPGNRSATMDRFAGYKRQDDTALLKSVTMPTQIIWGREDKLIPVSSADWFSKHLPNARVTILDQVGHIPMEEAPDRSLAPVLGLLEQVTPAR
ncbi:alpha/beta fold hydrolase [Sandarakinorhabdus sp. DWP1-3-1]|uniref:alpha/beta fold hydrolase n=1 Tax=Sandarakinorhabdus sp. DWP1-3-1 TaxID=2804627 RepID=UPI003CE6C6B9